MIKGIIFDKDGTLLEYEPFWFPVAENAIKILLDKYLSNDKLLHEIMENIGAYDGISGTLCHGTYSDIEEKFNEVMKKNGINDIKVDSEEIASAFAKCIDYGKIIPTCNNIKELFYNLKRADKIIAIVTSDNREITELCLSRLGIYEYVDCIYADDNINPSKPDPYYINCFMKDFSLAQSELLMVGDTLTDMNFASNGGIKAIGVAKREDDKAILMKKIDTVIKDISYLSNIKEIML